MVNGLINNYQLPSHLRWGRITYITLCNRYASGQGRSHGGGGGRARGKTKYVRVPLACTCPPTFYLSFLLIFCCDTFFAPGATPRTPLELSTHFATYGDPELQPLPSPYHPPPPYLPPPPPPPPSRIVDSTAESWIVINHTVLNCPPPILFTFLWV